MSQRGPAGVRGLARGVVNAALLDFYERALRDRCDGEGDAAKGHRKLQSGTVTVVQRTSSDLRLNPHLHTLALDGIPFLAEWTAAPARAVSATIPLLYR